jgi:hypothetical protein
MCIKFGDTYYIRDLKERIKRREKTSIGENMPYLQLFDYKKQAHDDFDIRINGIPHIILISPEGKILRKDLGLRGEFLDE